MRLPELDTQSSVRVEVSLKQRGTLSPAPSEARYFFSPYTVELTTGVDRLPCSVNERVVISIQTTCCRLEVRRSKDVIKAEDEPVLPRHLELRNDCCEARVSFETFEQEPPAVPEKLPGPTGCQAHPEAKSNRGRAKRSLNTFMSWLPSTKISQNWVATKKKSELADLRKTVDQALSETNAMLQYGRVREE